MAAEARRFQASIAGSAERLTGDRDVVERDLAAAFEFLALLVALAGDHDDVTGLRLAIASSIARLRSGRGRCSALIR